MPVAAWARMMLMSLLVASVPRSRHTGSVGGERDG
jgi:hypothetical protein